MTSKSMRFHKSCSQVVLAVLTLMIGSAGTVVAVDQVTKRSDRVTFRGEIKAMTLESITIALSNGQTQIVPVSDIFSVRLTWSLRCWLRHNPTNAVGLWMSP